MIEPSLHFGPFYQPITHFLFSLNHLSTILLWGYLLSLGLLIVIAQDEPAQSTKIFVKKIFSDKVFIFLGIAVIFIFRGLFFYQDQLNPDEAMHLTVALNLLSSPHLWVSADGTTLGPVCQLILVLFSYLFGGISYALARITCTILVAGTFYVLYKALKISLPQHSARFLSLFYVFFLSFGAHIDIHSFNCEIVANLFIALSIYYIFSISKNPSSLKIFLLGFCVGLLPYVKLQMIPIMIALIVWSVFVVYQSMRKRILLLFISLAIPTLALILYCSSYKNGLSNAVFYYLINANNHITSSMFNLGFVISSFQLLAFFLQGLWFKFAFFLIPIAAALLFAFKFKPTSDFYFSLLLLFASLFSIFRPLQPFEHYVILLVIPGCVFCAMIIQSIGGVRGFVPPVLSKSIFPTLMILLYVNMSQAFFGSINDIDFSTKFNLVGLNIRSHYWYDVSKIIQSLTTPKDSIVVWGWEERLNVYTNLKSATAQNNIERVLNTKYSPKNTDNYLDDIKQNSPKLIIDVVAPGSFIIEDKRFSLSKNEKIFSFVRDHYQLYCQINRGDGAIKIYIKKFPHDSNFSTTTTAALQNAKAGECKV